MAAETLDSDFDLAFRLQMEEALKASLVLHPSSSAAVASSSSSPSSSHSFSADHPKSSCTNVASLQSSELSKLEQEILDRKQSEIEMIKEREKLSQRMHDARVAREIICIPEEEWSQWGDDFEKPYGEGSSESSKILENDVFRVYFKGVVSENEGVRVEGRRALAGIGVAICDERDNLIFNVSKPLVGSGMSKQVVEIKALIEALNAATALDINRIRILCDYFPLYMLIIRRWSPKQRKVTSLISQVSLLQKKFTYCQPSLVARNDLKFAFQFARDAIVLHSNRPVESDPGRNLKETCVICLEDTDVARIFSVDGCLHRYCFTCMRQHAEVKLLYGMVPKCPHEGCKSELNVESCRNFLTPKLIDTMYHRINEASIPVTEKIYCPYPRCSALMSKAEARKFSIENRVKSITTTRKCVKCHGLFCIFCKVPWHEGMTCTQYRRLNPESEDAKLKGLASRNSWRQCVKCKNMIELSEGCYHMTCRCGYEFCYVCGAEWKGKESTCSCPLWDDEYILHDEDDYDSDSDFDDSESSDYD